MVQTNSRDEIQDDGSVVVHYGNGLTQTYTKKEYEGLLIARAMRAERVKGQREDKRNHEYMVQAQTYRIHR